MGIAERRERERAELRTLILEAAEKLFVKEGYENVSMRKIARQIEYSPTTIYRYFKNKSEVMEHLLERGYRGVRERYATVLDHSGDTPFDTLSMIIRVYVEFGVAHPDHYHLWHSATELRESGGALVMSREGHSLQVYEVWIDLIQQCQASGQLAASDPLALFKLVWGCVHGLISLRLQHPGIAWPPVPDQVDSLLDLLKRGLAPA